MIAPSYQHQALIQKLLADKDVITNITLQPLSVFLKTSSSKEEDYFSCAKELSKLIPSLNILSPYLNHPLFIEEIITFHNYFSCFQISIDSLPEENEIEKEIKFILHHLKDFKTTQIQQFSYTNQLKNLENVYLSEYFISDILQYRITQILLQKGVNLLPLSHQKISHLEIYKARNQRIEVEGIAQYLIQNSSNLKTTLLVYTDPSYQTLLQQVLTRYQIPFQFQSNNSSSLVINQFLHLLDFISEFSTESLINILENHCLPLKHPQAFCEYVSYFSLSPHDILNGESIYEPEQFISFNKSHQNALKQMIETALKDLDDCSHFLKKASYLHQKNDITETCHFLYSFLAQETTHLEEEDIFQQLSGFLEDSLILLQDSENPQIHLKHFLLQMQTQKNNPLSGLTLTPIQSFLLDDYETIFLLGTSSDYFPAIPVFQGIIDETYLAKIPSFPNAETRYHQYTKQLNRIFSCSKQLIISYSYGDYNGKSKELSFEIEEFASSQQVEIKEIPIIENNPYSFSKETLSEEISQKLFFNKQSLHGSVSSFETYFKCPYSYFLKHGLHLYNEAYPEIDVSYLGTLMHCIMENLITKKGKQYATTSKKEIQQEVQSLFSPIQSFFKGHDNLLEITIIKITALLYQSFQFLQELENHSNFVPIHSELEFSYTIPIDGFEIQLKGYIDRIDEYDKYFRILDLKSSPHSLSETKVLAGLQLQLLTYAWVYQQLSNKELMGVYYFSFTSGNIPTDAYHISRRPKNLQYLNESTYFDLFVEQRKLSGWTFDDPLILDDNAKHTKGLYINKNGDVAVRSGNYDTLKTEQFIHEIYAYLAQELWSGNISASPIEGACTYCDYHAICQFKGREEVPTPKLDINTFRKEKEV